MDDNLDANKLTRSEIGGMVAALLLVLSLFLPWYTLATSGVVRDSSADWVCGVGNDSCSGFDSFPILRWLLLAAATAPFILAYIVVRGYALSWPRGELTAVVGMTAFVLIAYNGFIDKPSESDIGISLTFGYFLALLSAAAIAVAGAFRAVDAGDGKRKPPATF